MALSSWREYQWTLESGASVRKSLVAITVHQPCANIHPRSRALGRRGTGSLIKHSCTTGRVFARKRRRESWRTAFQASSIIIMREGKMLLSFLYAQFGFYNVVLVRNMLTVLCRYDCSLLQFPAFHITVKSNSCTDLFMHNYNFFPLFIKIL